MVGYDVSRGQIMEALRGHRKSLKLPVTGLLRYKISQKKIRKKKKKHQRNDIT